MSNNNYGLHKGRRSYLKQQVLYFREVFNGISQAIAYSLILSHLSFIPYVQAGPTGANVVGGNGHVHYNGNVTDIHQVSSRLAKGHLY